MGQIDPEATLLIGPGTDAKRQRAAFLERPSFNVAALSSTQQPQQTITGIALLPAQPAPCFRNQPPQLLPTHRTQH
jgi:hypothetical protein